MEQFIMAQGISLRISDSLKGENVILLLHGYLETLSVWEEFSEALIKQNFRVISLDLPGHGLSESLPDINNMDFISDVLNEVIVKQRVEQCLVVGHSMGGYVALSFAKKYHDKTKALSLFHSTPNPDTDEKKANRDREIELIKAGKIELIINTSIPKMFANENVKRFYDKICEIKENALIANINGIIACLRGMKEREDMNAFLEDFYKPILFILGSKDNHIPIETANNILSRFPQAEHIMLEHSGHAGFIEEPETAIEYFMKFTKKVFD
jgi:pimeloyl-ACP methyl ester carboxylesterase